MKPLYALLLLPLALSGCMLELLTTTAIQGELAARDAQASVQALNYAKETKAKTEAEYAIRTYQAEKGSYPPSLASLVPGYLPALPKHADGTPFGYDPTTGALIDGPAAQAPSVTAQDRSNLEQIGKAIYSYWEATGYYPQSLDDLDPTYMTKVPLTSAGTPFVYDAQSGAVYDPNDMQPGAAAGSVSQQGVGGGAGPLGEVTAGIGIQNQLSNMNTSGVSNTGSAARSSVRNINNRHNQQQQQALDALDQ